MWDSMQIIPHQADRRLIIIGSRKRPARRLADVLTIIYKAVKLASVRDLTVIALLDQLQQWIYVRRMFILLSNLLWGRENVKLRHFGVLEKLYPFLVAGSSWSLCNLGYMCKKLFCYNPFSEENYEGSGHCNLNWLCFNFSQPKCIRKDLCRKF